MKKFFTVSLCVYTMFLFVSCTSTKPTNQDIEYLDFIGTVTEIEKYGHCITTINANDMYAAGYALGDVITVKFNNGFTFDAPLVSAYDVEKSQYMLRTEYANGYVAVCINYGNLAKEAGVNIGDSVEFSMKQKAGYLAQYEIRQLKRTDERNDYASDAIFANFREVAVGNIAKGVIYRGSHPTKTEWPRALYVSSLMEKAGIKTVINMSDTDDELKAYLDSSNKYASSYYKGIYEKGNVICLSMGMTYTDAEFIKSIVASLRFMNSHPAPYYVHCNEGKDRTGFIFILLEALMGAKQEEIMKDYMLSYVNYYGVEENSVKYNVIANEHGLVMLKTIANISDLSGVNLANATKKYLVSHGMSEDEVSLLQNKLSNK